MPSLRLRRLEPRDINNMYLSWFSDTEVTRYLDAGRYPLSLDDLKIYRQEMVPPNHVFLAIEWQGKHIGNTKLDVDWFHRRAEFSILIGDKTAWHKGIGTEVTRQMLHYAFRKLSLRKVSLGVLTENLNARKMYVGLGFKVEGWLRKHALVEGQPMGVIRMGLLREEYSV